MRHAPLGFAGFVALIAALMALNALAIDVMLPGLPAIGAAFALSDPNQAQTVISAYLAGFGIGQLLTGVLADRYGRRPVLLTGLVLYALAAFACVAAPSMEMLLAARFAQGLGSAAPRVVAVAAVRDCYGGRRMARVMSLVMMVFMAVPVLAPSLGQIILLLAPWRAVFGLLALYGVVMLWLCWRLLPETLHPEFRRPIRLDAIVEALGSMTGSRQTMGYMLAAGAFLGALFGFINSAQQALGEVLGLGEWFPAVFAVAASSIALASFVNARLVERLGMRVLSHGATIAYLALALAMIALERAGLLGLWVFLPLLTLSTLLVGLVFPNFNALAMEPQAHVAGVASSVIGAVTILIGAGGGYLVGQAFDGTLLPLAVGFAVFAAATLAVLFWAERGRLLRPSPPEAIR
ncbi:MAG: multidrug effflux MFS transporter [Alphaproteobacteria bacterium]|nr:multidrug effflux MFS transporter [Alphaproteobacteria bacterium]